MCIGNAMIASPKLLFLDEPSSGLDTHAKQNLQKILQNYVKNNSYNCGILFTTHGISEAENIC